MGKAHVKAQMEVDPFTGSAYIYLQPERKGEKGAVKESKRIDMKTTLDYDANGEAFGIEVLDATIQFQVDKGGKFAFAKDKEPS